MTIALLLIISGPAAAPDSEAPLALIAENTGSGVVEIRGVTAGPFDPAAWQNGSLHLLPDMRSPLLAPREGKFRNIYAPSAVQTPDGWRVFYGAWDGAPTGNDRIYCVDTPDFMKFGTRSTVIEHGVFVHVCNVNALRGADGSYEMMCTAYPDKDGLNKPAYFTSPDGISWNGAPMPYAASLDDIVVINGYGKYSGADINGMNVILREGGDLRLYFANFKDFGHVYRATRTGPGEFRLDGEALSESLAPNDVKKFTAGGQDWYLMGLHMNRERLWYSLSNDGLHFSPPQKLLDHLDEADRYIVALGWVVRDNTVLGVLYGAGPVPALNENRIFARWLQHRVAFVAEDGSRYGPRWSLGPDRQVIPVPQGTPVAGHFEMFTLDGVTKLVDNVPATVTEGQVWELTLPLAQ
jgi:hypothetical protein